MSDYLIRMEKELKELDKKIDNLRKFILGNGGIYRSLTVHDQDLLVAQSSAMYSYRMILKIRLDGGHMK